MTKQELEEKCLGVIAEATTRMQNAPTVKMQARWRTIRDTWVELLKKAQGAATDH
jgi:hypothetical protein